MNTKPITTKGRKVLITDLALPEENSKNYRIACLMDDRKLLDIRCENRVQTSILGNIYVGRVQKIVKNLNAAFIEIAPGLPCYYPMNDKRDPIFVHKIPSRQLVQGDEVLVQVERESVKTKAPSVTTNLNLTGRYLVLTTEKKQIGISAKIKKERREELKALIQNNYHGFYGVIVRTNAQNIPDQVFLEELQQMERQLTDMIKKAATRTCFSCIYETAPKYMAYLQNCRQEGLEEIVTDLPEVLGQIREYQEHYPVFQDIPVRFYEDALLSLANLYNLSGQIQSALHKKVWLKSGGHLIIEPTEALTVIDVNTGKSVIKKDPQKHFLKINLEAAAEIAHQMRLRNLSGIVIVDFIDLDASDDQQELLNFLRQAVRRDPVPVQVHDMTKLGLVEITRKKIEKNLQEQLTS